MGTLTKQLDSIKASMEALLAAAVEEPPFPGKGKEDITMEEKPAAKDDAGPHSQHDARKYEAKRLVDDLFEEFGNSEGLDTKKAKLMGALGLKEGGGHAGGTATPRASQESSRGRSRSPSKPPRG